MADPVRLSSAQERALARVRQEERLYSGDGVSAPTIQCLERVGLVRVSWIRRNVTAGHDKTNWATRAEYDWAAEPIIDDYQVFLRCGDREIRVTAYAAVSAEDAVDKAKARFWKYQCAGVEVPVVAVRAEPLSLPLDLLH